MEKYNKYILILIAVIVIGMSIGYSVLNSNLSITGDVNYRPQEDVRVTNFTANSKPDNITIEYSDYSKNQVKLGYTNTEEQETSIIYTVEITNYSTVNMGILEIYDTDENVEVQENIIGTKLVGSGGIKEFTITFNSTKAETKTYLLTFEFVPIYTVTYNGLGNTDNYVKEVLEGGQLKQDLGKDSEICSVTMDGRNYSDYSFSNETIIINNVTGNIVINGYAPDEPTIPNPPELNGDMIPVYYHKIDDKTGEWRKADESNLNNSWYDYTNQQWANAVTVVAEGSNTREYYKNEAGVGTTIPMSDINTMWVWIPRYSYTIKSEDGTNYLGKKSSCTLPTIELPGEIDVKFISKDMESEKGKAQYTGNEASEWRTNKAFDFPETDKEENNTPIKRGGIWVSKFEPTGSLQTNKQACTNTSCNVSNVTIKPSVTSIRSQTVSSFFYMSRSMQVSYADTYGFNKNSGDLHMMKNDEWGAVAYLSQSRYGKYGNSEYTGANKEVYINNDMDYITGHSGGSSSARYNETKYEYNNMTNLGEGQGQVGPGASTTGNIYGIYDMSGGAYEYVMGVLEYDAQGVNTHNGQIVAGTSGFKGLSDYGSATGSYDLPNKKYYNKYKSANPTSGMSSAEPELACNGGICYGHALSETYGTSAGWYGDSAGFISREDSWFLRGGSYGYDTYAGMFYSSSIGGYSDNVYSCRLVLTP